MSHRPLALALSAVLFTLGASVGAEEVPTLSLKDFKNIPNATGTGYKIEDKVPLYGYFAQFTVVTDDGTFVADGVEMLRIRIAEEPALAKLDDVSKSDLFVDALGKSAAQTGKAVGRAVTNPVDTISKVPAGVGRFFKSTGKKVASATTKDTSPSDGSALQSDSVNAAKREMAQPLGIDPYTRHPYLAKRLDDLAWATVAGGATLNVAMFAVTAGAVAAVSATASVSKLAWDLPPADIRAQNEKKLASLGVSKGAVKSLLDNDWYTPTLALDYTTSLAAFAPTGGADEFTQLAAAAESETEARFYVNQLKLAKVHGKAGALERRGLVGMVRTADGLFVPVPLDYLTQDEHVDQFVERIDDGVRNKAIWLTGAASPAAKAAISSNGWTLREHVALK